MGIELGLEGCRCILYGESFAGSYLELLIAVRTDGKVGRRADAFYDPQRTLFHINSLPQGRNPLLACGNQTAPLPGNEHA